LIGKGCEEWLVRMSLFFFIVNIVSTHQIGNG